MGGNVRDSEVGVRDPPQHRCTLDLDRHHALQKFIGDWVIARVVRLVHRVENARVAEYSQDEYSGWHGRNRDAWSLRSVSIPAYRQR